MPTNQNTKRKQVYLNSFKSLSQLESAVKRLKKDYTDDFQISILGKVAQFCNDKNIVVLKDISVLKTYWKDLMGTQKFGDFYSPEIGYVFIVGPLVSTFLHKINGKPLAALSSGSYGIFRGIGLSETQAASHMELLNTGHYLLILRGFEATIQELKKYSSTIENS